MVRSLSFIHLFVILAISYIGGALLFREMSATGVERVISFYDARVVQGHDAGYIRPVGTSALFFVITFALASFRKTRFTVLFFGAVKCVLFGMSSAYLLGSGMKMMEYAIWWFPFQFLICFLFLVYCAILSPPYFMRSTIGKKSSIPNTRALPTIIGMSIAVIAIEIIVFQFILK
ncbi:hypothetical protein FQ087_08035 [Sporosarcina sp. ANT_H38]|uniref:hypothetical protein n=1 Tax=Sporosarcina sp. ANT_H38 TaxID=2597358 RepID=UPI0011F0CA78|nr:hypothetical protein [Sporosarcina sp. ANT_H38]KAA0966182.1 hypothetical protein FQ087_08035 [Sporosarcina sp. ANT_H38]